MQGDFPDNVCRSLTNGLSYLGMAFDIAMQCSFETTTGQQADGQPAFKEHEMYIRPSSQCF